MMAPLARQRALVALCLAAWAAAAVPTNATAQPKPVSPASESAAPRARAAASASAAAPASAAPAPQQGGGAPSASAGLPPGHPPAARSPHGEADADDELFDAPPDGSLDDPSLPKGVVVVELFDPMGKPLPGQAFTLHVLENSVSKGESASKREGLTDDRGQARFEGLAVASTISYEVSARRGEAMFRVPGTPLGEKSGKRIRLHLYESTTDLTTAMVAIHANVEVSLREDALQLDHVLTLFNRGRNAWLPKGIDIPLPPGWKAFAPEDLGELVTIAREGDSLRLTGTVAPGRHHVAFRYQVPMGDRDAETVRVRLPPRVGAARVAAEAGGRIALEVKSFPVAEREPTRSGKKQLVTERQVLRQEAMSGGISELEVTLRGLPVRPSGPWISAALAALVAVFGLALAVSRKKAERHAEEREDLEEARDALLGELAELERLRAAGEVGPKSFAELEAALLDALARVLERLEALAPKKKRRKKAGAQGATA